MNLAIRLIQIANLFFKAWISSKMCREWKLKEWAAGNNGFLLLGHPLIKSGNCFREEEKAPREIYTGLIDIVFLLTWQRNTANRNVECTYFYVHHHSDFDAIFLIFPQESQEHFFNLLLLLPPNCYLDTQIYILCKHDHVHRTVILYVNMIVFMIASVHTIVLSIEAGHVIKRDDSSILMQLLVCDLSQARPHICFKDCLKSNIAHMRLSPKQLKECAKDMFWCALTEQATVSLEEGHTLHLLERCWLEKKDSSCSSCSWTTRIVSLPSVQMDAQYWIELVSHVKCHDRWSVQHCSCHLKQWTALVHHYFSLGVLPLFRCSS